MAASYQLEEGRVHRETGQLYRYGGLVEGTNSSLETFQTSPADRVATGQADRGLLSGLQGDPLLVISTDHYTDYDSVCSCWNILLWRSRLAVKHYEYEKVKVGAEFLSFLLLQI